MTQQASVRNIRLAEKMKANLASLEQNKFKPLFDEHAKKVEAARAAGLSNHEQHEEKLEKRIFDELVKLVPNDIKWLERSFFANDPKIDTTTDYSKEKNADGSYPTKPQVFGSYGWRRGRITSKYSTYFDFKWERTQTSSMLYSGKNNGKVRIYTGDYGDKSQYKQMKDGSHRYADIAQDLAMSIHNQKKRINEEAARRVNSIALSDIEYKKYNGISLSASADKGRPVAFKIDCTRNLTVEQAQELVTLLNKFTIG